MKRLSFLAVLATSLMLALPLARAAEPANRLEANKQLVRDFFIAFGMRDKAKLAQIVREDYIQHAPNFETGIAGTFKFIDALPGTAPTTPQDPGIIRMVAEGDMVVSHIRRQGPNGVNAAMDIFRIQDGKIAEHWGVQQAVPPEDKALNKNGFF